MALQLSGQLLHSDIAKEYNVTGVVNFSYFYGLTNVPAGGEIKISDFYGRSSRLNTTMTVGSMAVAGTSPTRFRYGYSNITVPRMGQLTEDLFQLPTGQNFRVQEASSAAFAALPTTFRLVLSPESGTAQDLVNYLQTQNRTVSIGAANFLLAGGNWTANSLFFPNLAVVSITPNANDLGLLASYLGTNQILDLDEIIG